MLISTLRLNLQLNCADIHSDKGQYPHKTQESCKNQLHEKRERVYRAMHLWGLSPVFGGCILFFILNSWLCVTFSPSPVFEVLGRYGLPKHPTTYSPFKMYSPYIMLCKIIKFSFKPTLGREVHTRKSIKPSHFPLKFKSSDCAQLCDKVVQLGVRKDLCIHSSRT